ncbi:MAG: methyltransferase domain-containing protein [Bacteroidota bacterium]
MSEKYYNEGWFGKNPTIYEIGSFFIVRLKRKAARKISNKPLKIIDLATGTGGLGYEMAKLGHEVVGIDLDENMLAKAHKKTSKDLKLSFLHGDATDLPFEDNDFDAATISFAMHDVPDDIGVKILKEARRVVKEDGFIFILDYNQTESFGAIFLYYVALLYESPNYKPFAKRDFRNFLEEIGFNIKEKDTFLGAVQMTKLAW